MIEFPAVFLSFDDNRLDLWNASLPLLADCGITATFYLSNLEYFTLEDWRRLGRIIRAGHSIGYHTLTHMRATEGIERLGWEKFYWQEIEPGMNMIKENMGLKHIRHFSYPWGTGNPATDHYLLKVFRTLRYGGREFFFNDDLSGRMKEPKYIFHAANFDKNKDQEMSGNEDVVLHAQQYNAATCLVMHKPIERRLQWLKLVSTKKKINFLGMDALI